MKQPDWMTVGASAVVAGLVSAAVLVAAPRADVRSYLLAHPEVIDEAGQKLQERASARAIDGERDAIFTPVGNAWAGNPNGDLSIVEFYDYACGYCRASLPVIRQLLADDPKLRVVFRELPVLSEQSDVAARMSVAAALQGKFGPFHDAMYAAGPLTPETIAATAQRVGVDPAKAGAAAPRAAQEIAANLRVARQLGMTGTPSWVIGDRVISGALPIDKLKEAIAAARSR